MKKTLLASALLIALSQAVHAAPPPVTTASFDFGTLSQTSPSASFNSISGPFNHFISFTLASGLTGAQALVSGIDNVGNLQVRINLGYGPSGSVTWGGFSPMTPVVSDPDTGEFAFTIGGSTLTSGVKYWANIQGSATDASYSLKVIPVPEPESWAMLMAGLGILGAVARRRSV